MVARRWQLCVAVEKVHHACRAIALCLFLAVAFSGSTALAQTSTWITGQTGNWSDAAHWTGGAPTSTSNVFIDGESVPNYPSSVTLNVNATVANLTLNSDDTLTFYNGTSVAPTLIVNGTNPASSCFQACAVFNGTTNVDTGTLTLNTTGLNQGTMTLSTSVLTIDGNQFLVGVGYLNGTGSLTNNGTLQGSGYLNLNITNTGTINNNDGYNLIVNGNIQNTGGTIQGTGGDIGAVVLNGSTITGGTFLNGNLSSTGGTLNGVALGQEGGGFTSVSILANSTLSLGTNGAQNYGFLQLAPGTVISGTGTLYNAGDERPSQITGGGTIASSVYNAGLIIATNSSSPLVLQGNVTQSPGLGTGQMLIENGSLVLDGAQVTGGTIGTTNSATGTLSAMNGATFSGDIDGTHVPLQLTSGSTLGISGTNLSNGTLALNDNSTLNITASRTFYNYGTIQLGNGTAGATINGPGTLYNQSDAVIQGGGTISAAISNLGTITANNSSAALVLKGNIDSGTGIGGVLNVQSGATMTLDHISVQTYTVNINAGSILNGNASIEASYIYNNGTYSPGLGESFAGTLFEQTASAVYDVSLGGVSGGQYTALAASFAELAGTLDVSLVNGFDPQSGDIFYLLETENPIGGSFASMSLPTLDAGLYWVFDPEETEILLEVEGTATGGGGGEGGGGGGGGTPAPEPASVLLLGIGLLGLRMLQRR
jgi:PEP-CTERM motif